MPADPDLMGAVRRRARALWDVQPDVMIVTPGRIDIVGNHVDYNGGDVIAAAIDRWVALAVRRRADGILRASVSDVGAGIAELPIEPATTFDLRISGQDRSWSDYAQAAVAATHAIGVTCPGVDIYYRGTIPLGAGMGSSAALLVSAVAGVAHVSGSQLSKLEIARCALDAGQRMNLAVGPLDQVTCAVGGFLRFSNDADRVQPLSASLGDAIFVVCDSGVRHSGGTLRYMERVEECRRALKLLHTGGWQIESLSQIAPADLDHAAALLPAPLERRVRHVVEEVERVKIAEIAIEAGECETLGVLMNTSGQSSAALFDISHPAVERIVDIARRTDGVYGARMMGAGDGGFALALLERDALPILQRQLSGAPVSLCRVARGLSVID